jgi:uncharacterized protein
MKEIQLKLDDSGRGAFVIQDSAETLARMEIAISGGSMTVYHTEVSDQLKGLGVASQLLSRMVDYARENKLAVIPLCPYVRAQFKRHPEQYSDIWNMRWHKT